MGRLLSPVDNDGSETTWRKACAAPSAWISTWVDRERGLASWAEDGKQGDGTKWCLYLMGGRQKANGSN